MVFKLWMDMTKCQWKGVGWLVFPFPLLQLGFVSLPFSFVWLAIEVFESPRNGSVPPPVPIFVNLSEWPIDGISETILGIL